MNVAIILGAGTGSRLDSSVPKQFIKLGNKRIITYSIEAFESSKLIDEIIIVVSPDWVDKISSEYPNYTTIAGGTSRKESSYNGLRACSPNTKKVLIHDAARPFISQKIITSCIGGLDTHKAVATSIPVTDTIVKSTNGEIINIEDRNKLFLNQTPQGFEYNTILKAHKGSKGDVTDDISLLKLDEIKCKVVNGSTNNIKITSPADIHIAQSILDLIK